MHAKSGMNQFRMKLKTMDDKTVRQLVQDSLTANLTPILKSIFDEMKCHNCIHLNKETMECPKTGLKVGEGTEFQNWGCSKFSIDQELFEVEIDDNHISIDDLMFELGADDKIVYNEQASIVFLNKTESIVTIGYDNFSNKIKEIYWRNETADLEAKIKESKKYINKIIVG